MQRALTELERTGLVYSMRTSGRFVTDDEEQIRSRKIMTAREAVEHFMRQMYELGLEKEEVLALIRDNQPEAQGQGGK
jgi:GntR family transcriptional regulator